MLRRTKIVSNLVPACEAPEILEKLILAGVNVVRLNFSHGSADEHRQRAESVRAIAKKHGLYVAVLGDLQGPKIRISRFANGPITLAVGDKFALEASIGRDDGEKHQVDIEYKGLHDACHEGETLHVGQ